MELAISIDHFEGIRSNRLLLERLDADVTVPLEACRPYLGPLLMRGPVRDVSVFRYITDNRGIWEPHLTEWMVDFLGDGGDVIDAGANLGYFSIVAGSLLAGKGLVVAFEPLKKHFDFCVQNAELNALTNVRVLRYALAEKAGTVQMAPHGDDIHHLGGAHLAWSDDDAAGTDEVECVSLDEMIAEGRIEVPNLRLIKMDIEGAEPWALAGMTGTLQKSRPVVAIEMNRYCLRKLGFEPADVWNALRDLDYRIMILPAEKQQGALAGLFSPSTFTKLREFGRLEQLIETADLLDPLSPPCFPLDLLAFPAESGIFSA